MDPPVQALLSGKGSGAVLESPALITGLDNVAVMRETVEQRCGHLQWMAGVPATLQLAGGEVFACHGSPAGGDPNYLLEDVTAGRPMLASEDAVRRRVLGIGPACLVLCGHTHVPRVVQSGTALVINPGSIGMPVFSAPLGGDKFINVMSPD